VFREPHQEIRGREAGKRRHREFRAAFPDIAATLHEVVAQDDPVAARYTLEGTHQAPFAGIPTGKRATLAGMGMFRLVGGRIVEGWGCADFFGFLQQLGAIPGREQPAVSGQRGEPRPHPVTAPGEIRRAAGSGCTSGGSAERGATPVSTE
jgi:predicted ester cyclase